MIDNLFIEIDIFIKNQSNKVYKVHFALCKSHDFCYNYIKTTRIKRRVSNTTYKVDQNDVLKKILSKKKELHIPVHDLVWRQKK